jgi:hypothetical protein
MYLSKVFCGSFTFLLVYIYRKILDLQHQYNNCTTIFHMRVSFTYWGPPSCEGLLYSCIDVVQESNPLYIYNVIGETGGIKLPVMSPGHLAF